MHGFKQTSQDTDDYRNLSPLSLSPFLCFLSWYEICKKSHLMAHNFIFQSSRSTQHWISVHYRQLSLWYSVVIAQNCQRYWITILKRKKKQHPKELFLENKAIRTKSKALTKDHKVWECLPSKWTLGISVFWVRNRTHLSSHGLPFSQVAWELLSRPLRSELLQFWDVHWPDRDSSHLHSLCLQSNLSWEGQLMGTRENVQWWWMFGIKKKLTVGLQVSCRAQDDGRMPHSYFLLFAKRRLVWQALSRWLETNPRPPNNFILTAF